MYEDYIEIGRIYREHGVKGLCKFHSYEGEAFFDHDVEYILESPEGESKSVKILEWGPLQRYFLILFDCFSNREDIIPWRKARLMIHKDEMQNDDDQIYDHEWEGFEIFDEHDKIVGTIKEVIHNPLKQFVVDCSGEEKLIPLVEDWVIDLDKENRKIKMSLPEGL